MSDVPGKPSVASVPLASAVAPGGDSKTRELAAKHGALAKTETRGRHPLDCRCGQCVGSKRAKALEVSRTADVEPVSATRPPLDHGIIQKSLGKLASTVDRYLTRRVFRVATKVSGGDKNFAQELAHEAGMKTDELELISDLGADVCEQYEISGQHAPALALAICLVDYGSRMTEALNKLAEMEKRQAEKSPKPKDGHANGDPKSLSGGA